MTEPNQLDEIDELLALLIQREITPADFSNAIQVIIAKAQKQAISDYQTNFFAPKEQEVEVEDE